MRVKLEREAEQEMIEAAQFYNQQKPGLGEDFFDEVAAAVGKIGANPLRFAFYQGSKMVRSIRLERFPYRLLFVAEAVKVSVVAVAHLHRHPAYWNYRLS